MANKVAIPDQATICRFIGARRGIPILFGFSILEVIGFARFARLPRTLKEPNSDGSYRGRPGSREGSIDALPPGAVPAILRIDKTDPSRPLRATRVRIHVLDGRDRPAPPRVHPRRGTALVSHNASPGPRLLLERILRNAQRRDDGGEGVARRRFDFRPRRRPPTRREEHDLS